MKIVYLIFLKGGWGATLGTAWYGCRKSKASSRNSFTKNDACTLNKFITRKVIKSQP